MVTVTSPVHQFCSSLGSPRIAGPTEYHQSYRIMTLQCTDMLVTSNLESSNLEKRLDHLSALERVTRIQFLPPSYRAGLHTYCVSN